jgi:hypothetical protein
MSTDTSTVEIWIMVGFPTVLTLIQILVSRTTRPIYLWFGFTVVCAVSIGLTLYLLQSTNLAKTLIGLAGAVPILFAVMRFSIVPFWRRYGKLKVLPEILGAEDWGLKRSENIDTYVALESARTSFNFMGFGFSKYLKATPDRGVINGKNNLRDSLLWKKMEAIFFSAPDQPLRILMMNPLGHEIDKYSKLLKDRYPDQDVEEDLYFSLECLKEMQSTFGEMVQVRFYPYSKTYKPSFRLFFSNGNEFFASFYSWGTTGTDLPYIHLKKSERTFFLPFLNLFDYLWENGEPADIESMPLTIEFDDIYAHRAHSIDRVRKHIRYQLPHHLREIPFQKLRVAAVAVAGRDSALAILQSARSGLYDCIIPILVGTPAKYLEAGVPPAESSELGVYEVRNETIRRLRRVVNQQSDAAENSCHLLNMVFVATNTRAWVTFLKKAKFRSHFDTGIPDVDRALASPCIPCHAYIYYLRAMLCHRLGVRVMIGGDRLVHGQKVKLNQLTPVLESILQVSEKEFGVKFLTPLREIPDNTEIRKSLDALGLSSVPDVDCLFDGEGTISLRDFEALGEEKQALIGNVIQKEVLPELRRTMYELFESIPSPQHDHEHGIGK